VNDLDYELLVCIAEELNFTRASERLFLTQSALAYRLAQIENEFGVPIVDRTARKIRMTPEGEYLVTYARQMIAQMRLTKDHVVNMRAMVGGMLRIGVSSYIGLHTLPRVLRTFQDRYPGVRMNVHTGFSDEVYGYLLSNLVHLCVVRGEFPWEEERRLLEQGNICVIAKSKIEIEDLPKLPLIAYNTTITASRQRRYGIPFGETVERWWRSNFSQPPNVIMYLDSYETCKEMVRYGMGYSIVPGYFVSDSDQLYAIPLVDEDGQLLKRNTWLLLRSTSLEYPVVEQFICLLESAFKPDADRTDG